ncbi:MAG TPA: type II toxin-antitoxin system prevent-host-death family antitoxin [Dehalococcoidia bacterium]|nr:type II toxin-antitoxin system prevent-host-death family antitoxin [Dehalococcoidia bacterium]
MRVATITEAKNQLSALIDVVRAGETVLITDRGIPVARLEPAAALGNDDNGRLARLERAGIIRRGKGDPLKVLLRDPPRTRTGASAVEALLEERRNGR